MNSLCAVLAVAAAAAAAVESEYHRYIIVGAGPGGMQLAHYMQSAGRDYVVVERAEHAGSFFARFPRWRQLISINKPHTGRSDLDFNMRHDWNSVLSEVSTSSNASLSYGLFVHRPIPCLVGGAAPASLVVANTTTVGCVAADYSSTDDRLSIGGVAPGLLFRDYASTYYPHADELLKYLKFWSGDGADRGHVLQGPIDTTRRSALRIEFNVTVARVERPRGWMASERQAHLPSDPTFLSAGGRRFRLTTSSGRVLECTYLIWAAGLQNLNRADGVNIADFAENYWTHSTDLARYVNKSVLILGRGNGAFEIANHVLGVTSFVHVVGRDTGRIRLSVESHYPGDVRHIHSTLLESYLLKSMDGLAELPQGNWELSRNSATGKIHLSDSHRRCRVDAFGRAIDRCILGREYDIVISVPGWKFDSSPFAPDVRPANAPHGKHPALTPGYESTNVTGLYFAGTLAHAHDYRKSSGGFIHGFRYTARALHRVLEETEQAIVTRAALDAAAAAAAPSTSTPPTSTTAQTSTYAGWPRRPITGLRSATSALLKRMNRAAGIYQMFGTLVDVLVLPPFPASAAANFSGPGVFAPFFDPASFPDPTVDDPTIPYRPAPEPHSRNLPLEQIAARASDAVVDAAIRGAYFEELPLTLPPQKVAGWAAQVAASTVFPGIGGDASPLWTSSVGGVEWITLSLEFGGASHPELHHSATSGSVPSPPAMDAMDNGAADAAASSPSARKKAKGKGSSSMAAGDSSMSTAATGPSPDRIEDPFSLLRANSTFWNPEWSRFLHPVLRYYHSALDSRCGSGYALGGPSKACPLSSRGGLAPPLMAPVLEHHILEDFNNDWTHFNCHVLSVARFLQDVAARRASVALDVRDMALKQSLATARRPGNSIESATSFSSSTSSSKADQEAAADAASPSSVVRKPPSTSSSSSSAADARKPLSEASVRMLLSAAWHVRREWTTHEFDVRRHAHEPFTTVHAFGVSVPGSTSWFHAFSIDAIDQLMWSGPRILSIAWRDTAPFPLTPAENATMLALEAALASGSRTGSGATMEAVSLSMNDPPMSEAAYNEQRRRDALVRSWYAASTAKIPGSILLEVRARTGMGQDHARTYGGLLGAITVVDSRKGTSYAVNESRVLSEATARAASLARGGSSATSLSAATSGRVEGGARASGEGAAAAAVGSSSSFRDEM